jgi:hypothetical protein
VLCEQNTRDLVKKCFCCCGSLCQGFKAAAKVPEAAVEVFKATVKI